MMDPTVFGQLVDEHAAALELYARQWCAAPEDVVQEAFLKLVTQSRMPRNVVPWLFRVVRNQAINVLRSAQRRRKHETRAAERNPQQLFAGEGAAGEGTLLDGEAATLALQALPEQQREIITLHLWGGLTFAEIAEVIDSSASTVHRWYLAGLNQLRERLDVLCPHLMKKS
jgi:RNA polymerase sigma factor (sigma-70 family)